jgi:hypothetical protein
MPRFDFEGLAHRRRESGDPHAALPCDPCIPWAIPHTSFSSVAVVYFVVLRLPHSTRSIAA